MRRRAPSIEQAGFGQDERAAADRHEARAACVGIAERFQYGLRRAFVEVAPTGDDDRSRSTHGRDARVGADRDATDRAQWPGVERGDLKLVPVDVELGARR